MNCVKCGRPVNMVATTFQGQSREKKVNPDGSNHNLKIGEKWYCVSSYDHANFAKEHGGPSGYVSKINTFVLENNTPAILETNDAAKPVFQYHMLNVDQRKIIEKKTLELLEIRHLVEGLMSTTDQKGNQAAIGQILNLLVQTLPKMFLE